ncbi:MAG: FIST N-terminal domain-containing protein [Planctomycetota bacterium]|nr:FIST N-terminal domain-containing protein [Planctomycetota bacterium]
MATVTGSGRSSNPDSGEAIVEALNQAKATLAGPNYDLGKLLSDGKEHLGVDLMGSTTAGEFTEEGLTHNGVVVYLIATDDDTMVSSAFAQGMKDSPLVAAASVCREFSKLKTAAFRERKIRSTTILLTDGLSGEGEVVLKKVSEKTSAFQQIVGGAAGDEGAFNETSVGYGDQSGADSLACYHIFSKKSWGVGVGHGLRPASEKMRITKARGNVVYEIDGKPAFEVYQAHAKSRGVELTRENAGPYLIGNELGVYFFNKISKARAPLSVGDDGSLSCAANIAQGSSVAILDGDPESMANAARDAAEEAKKHLAGEEAAGVILFDCVCRGMIFKDKFQQEIDAVRDVFGDVPIAGYLTYGEIARYKGTMGGWHNTTAVVLAIPK